MPKRKTSSWSAAVGDWNVWTSKRPGGGGAPAAPIPANNRATATTMVTAQTDLAITKSDSPDPVNAGAPLTYTLTVTNNGPSAAAMDTVRDTLPAGVNLLSAAGTGWILLQAGRVG